MEVVVDEAQVRPSETVTGSVRFADDAERASVRGITVELVQTNSSRRGRGSGSIVLAETRLESAGVDPLSFSIELPLSVVPDFRSDHGEVESLVRAKADRRKLKASAALEVLEPSWAGEPADGREVPIALPAGMLRARPAAEVFDMTTNGLYAAFFAGIFLYGMQGYLFEEAGKNGLTVAAIGFFIAVCILFWYSPWNWLALRGVKIEPTAEVLSRGQSFGVTVSVGRPGLSVGLEGVERYRDPRKSGHLRQVDYASSIFYDSAQPLEPGTTEVQFHIPRKAHVSYAGSALSVDWRIAVTVTDRRGKTKRLKKRLTPLLVIH